MGLLLEERQRTDGELPLSRGAPSAGVTALLLSMSLSLGLATGCRAPAPPAPTHDPQRALVRRIDNGMERGAAYLIGAQAGDGRWASQAYPAFGGGRALTPLILSALLFSPAATPRIGDAYAQGVEFVASATHAGEVPQYPAYAYALGAMVLSVPANRRHLAARDRLITALRERQLTEVRGWSPADASHGGWGYWPQIPVRSPAAPAAVTHELLSANLSTTLFALSALVMAGVPAEDPAFASARAFVRRCQNHPGDGGFFFTPANDLQNKAGPRDGGFRSYGTMTSDGIRALFLLGVPADDPGLRAAAAWLTERWDPAVPAGRFPDGAQWQRDGAYYYWAWSSAHALYGLGGETGWSKPLVEELLGRQEDDGAWRNRFTSMREDDPLVATPMALAGLGLARLAITGQRRTSIPMR